MNIVPNDTVEWIEMSPALLCTPACKAYLLRGEVIAISKDLARVRLLPSKEIIVVVATRLLRPQANKPTINIYFAEALKEYEAIHAS